MDYKSRLRTYYSLMDIERDITERLNEIKKLKDGLYDNDSSFVYSFISQTKKHLENNLKIIDDLLLNYEDKIKAKENLSKIMVKNLKMAEDLVNFEKEKVMFT